MPISKMAMITFMVTEKSSEDIEVLQETEQDCLSKIKVLEQELQYVKESLQATIEELETSNEELQATNEELLSSNEELQSTNEELQSVNEELITLNSEYQLKITELTDLNNDFDNFLSSTNIGTLFLDRNLNVRKFTPNVTKVINLIKQDVGRSISHISHNLIGTDIVNDSRTVLDNLSTIEREVRNIEGEVFLKTVFPYKTRDNAIKGVVVTFVNITELRNARNEIQKLSFTLWTNPLMVVIADTNGKIVYVNEDFFKQTGYSSEEVNGRNVNLLSSGKTGREVYNSLWNNLNKGCQWRGEFVNRKKNGDLFKEYAFISPITDFSGAIVYYIQIAEEVPIL